PRGRAAAGASSASPGCPGPTTSAAAKASPPCRAAARWPAAPGKVENRGQSAISPPLIHAQARTQVLAFFMHTPGCAPFAASVNRLLAAGATHYNARPSFPPQCMDIVVLEELKAYIDPLTNDE